MISKIESTGCCERRGMVQIRVSFFLEPDEPGYDYYHVQVPVEKYQGLLNDRGQPTDPADYARWRETCEKKWVNTPCHNHFFRIVPNGPEDNDDTILKIMQRCATEVLRAKKTQAKPILINPKKTRLKNVTDARRAQCRSRVASLPVDEIRVRKRGK